MKQVNDFKDTEKKLVDEPNKGLSSNEPTSEQKVDSGEAENKIIEESNPTIPVEVKKNEMNSSSAVGAVPKYNPLLNYIKERIPDFLGKVGLTISVIIYTFNPSNFNLIVVLIYIVSFLFNNLLIHKKGFGVVYDRATRKILPNAQISIISATLGNTLGMTQTDLKGRYYVLLPYGDYQIKTKITDGQETFESEVKKITKKHCVVDFDIAV